MSSFEEFRENSEDNQQSVFDIDPAEASIEYLADVTDEFASHLVYNLLGQAIYEQACEDNEVRIMAVKMCAKFLELMHERAKRQETRSAAVEWLNSLL
jgi:hypothetical protein